MKLQIRWGVALGFGLWFMACVAWAQGPGAVRKHVEASMRVTGTITIRADGNVAEVALDKQERLARGVADFVRENTAGWRFEPVMVDGQARDVRTPMSVRLVGRSIGGGKMEVSIRGVDFGGGYEGLPPTERLTAREMTPPGYPQAALEHGVQGTAYLLIRIGQDGRVADAVAEQVNLRYLGSEAQMTRFRERLARVSLVAAKRWSFNVPTEGEYAGLPHWVVRVPVDFTLAVQRYGQWEVYVPGPRERIDWAQDDDRPGFSPDALAEGGVHMAGGKQGPTLLTPLDGV